MNGSRLDNPIYIMCHDVPLSELVDGLAERCSVLLEYIFNGP